MSYQDFIKQNAEAELLQEQRKKQVAELQERISAAAKNIPTSVYVYDLVNGSKKLKQIRYREETGTKYIVILKYKIHDVFYVSTTEIIKEYKLTKQAIINRLRSNKPKWKDWLEL